MLCCDVRAQYLLRPSNHFLLPKGNDWTGVFLPGNSLFSLFVTPSWSSGVLLQFILPRQNLSNIQNPACCICILQLGLVLESLDRQRSRHTCVDSSLDCEPSRYRPPGGEAQSLTRENIN